MQSHLPAVEFKNVSIVFGDTPKAALPLMDQGANRDDIKAQTNQIMGVHDCSLRIEQGEILVLMGLSGSGKSTLVRAVNGLNPVIRGEVLVNNGQDMTTIGKADDKTLLQLRRNRIAMVFQQFGLLPWRSVRENVGLGLELAGLSNAERQARVNEQLELVNLAQWADRKVGELSGGMQQRVGLARAFVTQAPILLMDEPFSALDPLIRAKLQDELLELQAKLKRTIIFVSHDLDEAFKLGNRIAFMEDGRIVQCGTPHEIIANPVSDYVAEFVANMNPILVLRAKDVMTPQGQAPANALSITPEMPVKAVMELFTQGHSILAVHQGNTRLGSITMPDVMQRLLNPQSPMPPAVAKPLRALATVS